MGVDDQVCGLDPRLHTSLQAGGCWIRKMAMKRSEEAVVFKGAGSWKPDNSFNDW